MKSENNVDKHGPFWQIFYSAIIIILVLCCRLHSEDFFYFVSQNVEIIFCVNMFMILSFSPSNQLDGFFICLGSGHLFIAFFIVCHEASMLHLVGTVNEGIQSWSCERIIEIVSYIFALSTEGITVPKRFVGYICLCYLAISSFLLATIFRWKNFPLLFEGGRITPTHTITDYCYLASYIMIFLFVFRNRYKYQRAVSYSLLVSLTFKALLCIVDGISSPSGPANAYSLTCKLASFTFCFLSVGAEAIRNPYLLLNQRLANQRKVTESQRKFSESILRDASSLIVIFTKDFKIKSGNKAARLVTDSSEEGMKSMKFFDLFCSDSEEYLYGNQLRVMTSTDTIQFSATTKRTKKRVNWTFSTQYYSTNNPDTDKLEEFQYILAIGQDLTYKLVLEDLKRDRNKEGDFISTVSHELRTPLNCIVGMSSLLLLTNINSEQRDMLTTMYDTSISMIDIVNDILDFQSFKQGKLKFQLSSFNLRRTIEELLQGISMLYQTKRSAKLSFGYYVSKDCPTFLRADPKRIRQVMLNFLSNAIKATLKGHVIIYIKMQILPAEIPNIEFAVLDSGPGIENTRELFDKNLESKYAATNVSGSGLGLGICKDIVEGMNGKIGVQSTFGVGSKFWFTLPIADSKESAQKLYSKSNQKIRRTSTTASIEPSKRYLFYVKDESISNIIQMSVEEELNIPLEAEKCNTDLRQTLLQFKKFSTELESIVIILESENVKNDLDINVLNEIVNNGITKLHVICLSGTFVGIVELTEFQFRVTTVSTPLRLTSFFKLLSDKDTNYAESLIIEKRDSMDDISTTLSGIKKILIVEDNIVNQRVLGMILKKLGYEYDAAENGQEGVDFYIKNQNYFVILMDCNMPIMDGFTATMKIRQFEKTNKLPRTKIIALTGNASESDRKQCLNSGMDDYLPKPLQIDELKVKLQL